MTSVFLANFLIALICMGWATTTGPEILAALWPESTQSSPLKKPLSKSVPSSQISVHPELKISGSTKINQKKFLHLLTTQASERNLTSCLQKSSGQETGSLAFAADLTISGKLVDVRAVGTNTDLPVCVKSALSDMDFFELVARDHPIQQAIYWRLDW